MNGSILMAKTWWRFFKHGIEGERANYFERLKDEMARGGLAPEDIDVEKAEFEKARNEYGKPNTEDEYVASFN